MDSIFYPTLLLIVTLIFAIGALLKLRRELSDAASMRIGDIGRGTPGMSAEQFMAIARAQAGLPCSEGSPSSRA